MQTEFQISAPETNCLNAADKFILFGKPPATCCKSIMWNLPIRGEFHVGVMTYYL